MGYACPVCDDPQQDAEHLANHLAFQALTHGDDHESWLDDHAPGWVEAGPAELGPRLAELADEADYEAVFDDTTGGRDAGDLYDPDLQGTAAPGTGPTAGSGQGHGHGHGHDHEHGHEHEHEHGHGHADAGRGGSVDAADLDPETRAVVEEARELTREMLSPAESEAGTAADADGDESETGE
jgi:hypothetical protein